MTATVERRLAASELDDLDLYREFRIHAEARETETLARLATDPDPYRDGRGNDDKDWIVEDVACALRVASAVAAAKLHIAHQLATRFPATFAALRDRRLELRYATRLVEAAEALPDPALPELERTALERVETQTLGQFTGRVRRLVAKADPRADEEQHEEQRAQRRVTFTALGHGMTELWALLPADSAAALQSVVQGVADKTKGDDDRTADQRRADALCELAIGDHGVRPIVQVSIPVSTLLGVAAEPGELAGHGPIPAAMAQALAFDPTGTWRRLLTDASGQLCDVSSCSYHPPAAMERFVQLRDRTCRFPTCRRRAESCEIDHVVPWLAGGPTTPANLIPLCSRHHHLKHDGGWRVERHHDGAVTWTTPTGRRWRTPPPETDGG